MLDTVVERVRKAGHDVAAPAQGGARDGAAACTSMLHGAQETDSVGAHDRRRDRADDRQERPAGRRTSRRCVDEFELFREELNGFQFALSRPYYTLPEKQQAGSGGLLSITVNPYTCKGCMECVEVCDDDALKSGDADRRDGRGRCATSGTSGSTCRPRRKKYIRVDDLEEGIGALETILLDKNELPGLRQRRRRLPGLLARRRCCTCSPPRSRR